MSDRRDFQARLEEMFKRVNTALGKANKTFLQTYCTWPALDALASSSEIAESVRDLRAVLDRLGEGQRDYSKTWAELLPGVEYDRQDGYRVSIDTPVRGTGEVAHVSLGPKRQLAPLLRELLGAMTDEAIDKWRSFEVCRLEAVGDIERDRQVKITGRYDDGTEVSAIGSSHPLR